ncbi:SWPV1-030 [Shearwaterpox virus]|uniref:SWPV1-030 n=1 Tax=Shearwaterpox virus TaxID=1974596 RepID=A0A1V0S7Q3_CNPV|nr:SWPV1-030 [Shearwaterpox virus]
MARSNIFTLVSANNVEAVSELINLYRNIVYKKNKKNKSPIYIAIHKKFHKMTELLLLNNSSLNTKIPPLIVAAKNNDLIMMKLLVKYGGNINDSYLGDTPLMIALRANYVNIVEYLLSLRADFLKSRHNKVYSYISMETYELLFRHNCNINIVDRHGHTPIYYAVNNTNLLKFLLNNNVAMNNNLEKWLVLKNSISLSIDRSILRQIYNSKVINNDNDDLLLYAVKNLNLKGVRFILEEGHYTDPIESVFNRSPLYYALKKRNIPIIEELIKYGAGKRMATLDISTLPLVISSYDIEMIKKILSLIREDIDPEYSMYLLLDAIKTTNVNIVKLILDLGVAVCIDKSSILPLQSAICKCNVKIIELLLDYGARIHVTDINGNTPLHEAVSVCHFYSIKRLLELGADINAINDKGHTPISLLCTLNSTFANIGNKSIDTNKCHEEKLMISHLMLLVKKNNDVKNNIGYKKSISVINKSSAYRYILLRCNEELEYLNTQHLGDGYTLLSFLIDENINNLIRFSKHPKLKKLRNLKFYRTTAEKILNRVKNRYVLVSKASDYMSKNITTNIPVEISSIICRMLTDKELENLIL